MTFFFSPISFHPWRWGKTQWGLLHQTASSCKFSASLCSKPVMESPSGDLAPDFLFSLLYLTLVLTKPQDIHPPPHRASTSLRRCLCHVLHHDLPEHHLRLFWH
ncbi:hypothetical protein FOVG_02666 [Fusarium oxysporum f. sp. pisi HDV247]|uniref:Uncharacterized protein n=1 Tax=Fusarium oxysporum f. sp. pisi HDV247 TaxID=1080344 RepID=W9Q2R7_FUSOX|nr:hypothetical protein FOVG_02666 [Fusarium oxysporum f. sp. pisi HDV247]